MPSEPSPSGSRGAGGKQKDVSLAPACLIVAVIAAVAASVAMIALAALMGKGGNGAYEVREKVIPWVEQSPLTNNDQRIIVERLNTMASEMERDELTSRQMSRLAIRLRESPVLQWGVVEQLVAKAKASAGLTEDEKQEFASQCDRWLLSAVQGKLSLQDMEFAIQHVATKDGKTGTLTSRDNLSDEQLREFQRRVGTILDTLKIPNEPYDKSVSQAFLQVLDEALSEK
ncbi:MAG: hypothetical protein ABL921_04385 [Pirellula sp.]